MTAILSFLNNKVATFIETSIWTLRNQVWEIVTSKYNCRQKKNEKLKPLNEVVDFRNYSIIDKQTFKVCKQKQVVGIVTSK